MFSPSDSGWLESFHGGDRALMGQLYEDYYEVVVSAVSRFVVGADRENLVHDVFCALLDNEELRRNYKGGSLRAWLATVARNRAVDYVRRLQRKPKAEQRAEEQPELAPPDLGAELRIVVQRCREEIVPKKWMQVFELRFVEQLTQRECAERLEMSRTTLLYQEARIRSLLRRFLLGKKR